MELSDETIINLLAIGTLIFAVLLSIVIRNTKIHKVLTFIFYPLIKLKDFLDGNYWADKIGEKSGAYEKARNSKFRKWVDSLEGWKWWTWQIVGGIVFIIVLETILNLIGLTMLPWK
jgi:hypothetical protein